VPNILYFSTISYSVHHFFLGLGQALKRLFTNPIYVSVITGLAFSIFGFIGVFTFIPKYIENQFEITASRASMFLGT
jgi:predicted permease